MIQDNHRRHTEVSESASRSQKASTAEELEIGPHNQDKEQDGRRGTRTSMNNNYEYFKMKDSRKIIISIP